MSDLWEELNNSVPSYLETLIINHQLQVVKLNSIKTALVSKEYALIISMDRFYVDVDYITVDDRKKMVKYPISNFLAEKYDEKDRVDLIKENTAREIIINNLIVINQGLQNKWRTILLGEKDWIIRFKQSKWFSELDIQDDEKILGSIMCN